MRFTLSGLLVVLLLAGAIGASGRCADAGLCDRAGRVHRMGGGRYGHAASPRVSLASAGPGEPRDSARAGRRARRWAQRRQHLPIGAGRGLPGGRRRHHAGRVAALRVQPGAPNAATASPTARSAGDAPAGAGADPRRQTTASPRSTPWTPPSASSLARSCSRISARSSSPDSRPVASTSSVTRWPTRCTTRWACRSATSSAAPPATPIPTRPDRTPATEPSSPSSTPRTAPLTTAGPTACRTAPAMPRR